MGRDQGAIVIATVIQQNPDLCGVVGFWDVMDLGAAAAIKESGKPIALVTSGGGEQMACDNVEKGVFEKEIAYQVMDQGRDLNDMIHDRARVRAAGRQGEDRHLQPATQDHQRYAPPGSVLEREEPSKKISPRHWLERAEPQKRLSAFFCAAGMTS